VALVRKPRTRLVTTTERQYLELPPLGCARRSRVDVGPSSNHSTGLSLAQVLSSVHVDTDARTDRAEDTIANQMSTQFEEDDRFGQKP
jgi:hypothetical protein